MKKDSKLVLYLSANSPAITVATAKVKYWIHSSIPSRIRDSSMSQDTCCVITPEGFFE